MIQRNRLALSYDYDIILKNVSPTKVSFRPRWAELFPWSVKHFLVLYYNKISFIKIHSTGNQGQ